MTNEVAINQKEVTTNILTRVDEMQNEGLALPKNYNVSNALNVAFLKIKEMKVKGQPVLNIVTRTSVQETLLNMALQGLSPAKNQVYFIPYGNQLQMQRSYQGSQAVLKRIDGVKDIWANVIYEADDFVMEIDNKGIERFVKHDTNWQNRDGEIIGAYAIVDTEAQGELLTVMTRKEINASWSQAKTSNVHNKFGQEMAKRTVINRAAKNIINTSDDSDLLIHAVNKSTEDEYVEDDDRRDVTEEETADNLLNDFKAATSKEEAKNNDEEVEYAEFEEIEKVDESEKEPKEIDWSKWSDSDIKKALDNKNIVYQEDAKRDELIAVAEMAINGGVIQNELL